MRISQFAHRSFTYIAPLLQKIKDRSRAIEQFERAMRPPLEIGKPLIHH